MRTTVATVLAVFILVLSLTPAAPAQSGPGVKKGGKTTESQPPKKVEPPTAAPEATDSASPQEEAETVKVETNLVTIPVVVSDSGDKYVPDLRRDEFSVYEDGVQQQVAYFDTVTAPFHVVLMLDTSASTQEKLGQIQRAAITFTEQLQPADRVKVISFDDQIRDLCDFSSDRAVIQWAIKNTRVGKGTKLYDAVALAINKLYSVKGRKAIVIFTDGVDNVSDRETYDRNRKALQESGIIVYPIRYETREDVERLVRQQQRSGETIDVRDILSGNTTRGTTPKTFPGEDDKSLPVPTSAPGRRTPGILGLPGGISIRRDPTNDPRGNRDPTDPSSPDDRYPRDTRNPRDDRYPDNRSPDGRDSRWPNDRGPDASTSNRRDDSSTTRSGRDESISAQLDLLYATGDAYLEDLATETGGSLYRADTLFYLPDAFAKIAAELRTQYSIGYYPTQTARDGKYHKIRVKISRRDVSVRARPGYRARTAVK
jgi:hypothetical protein